jgi:hypothetical protein
MYRIFYILGPGGNYYALKNLENVFDKNFTHLLLKTTEDIYTKNIYMFFTRF